IVDIFMPGMDGIETIRTLRTYRPAVPIVAISGAMAGKDTEGPDFLSIATKFGAVTTLPKPFRPRELLEAARRALASREYAAILPDALPSQRGDGIAPQDEVGGLLHLSERSLLEASW